MKNNQAIKIGFFGTPQISLSFLEFIFENGFNISFVVCQPPAKSGRGKKEKKSPVQIWGEEHKIKIFNQKNLNNFALKKEIQEAKVDFNLVVAYGNLIPEDILNYPKYFSLNVHASLLPRWRGAAPIQWAILSGDNETGVSIMKVEKRLDAGPVFSKKKIKIRKNDSCQTIYDRIIFEGKSLLVKTINEITINKFTLKSQNEKDATYAKKITKDDCKINWNKSADQIMLKIKAFSPYPGAWSKLKNGTRIKIIEAELISSIITKDENMPAGKSLNNLIVKCGKGFIRIIRLQKEGKVTLNSKEFLNGNKLEDIIFIS